MDVRVEEQIRDDGNDLRKWTIRVELGILPRKGECIGFPNSKDLFEVKDLLWEEQFRGESDVYSHHEPVILVKELPLPCTG